MKLIDADALLEEIAKHEVHDTIRRKLQANEKMAFEWAKGDMYLKVKNAPTVDAIPVESLRKIYESMPDDIMMAGLKGILILWEKEKERQEGKK